MTGRLDPFRSRRNAMGAACLVVGLQLVAAPDLPAQSGRSEAVLLREAAALESRGELDAAAEVLQGLLERQPTSSGGLFALERILLSRGTLAGILPFADRFLEVEPRSAGTRHLKLRVLMELDSLEALEPEIRRWIEAEPNSPEPWREGARMVQQAFGAERALALLEEGRQTLDDPDALTVEQGDLLHELGRPAEAVEAWGRAIGPDGSEVSTVLRRLDRLEGDRGALVRPLVEALDAAPTTVDRRRAAVRVALESGLPAEAVAVAGRVLPDLEVDTKRGFLIDLSRRAEGSGAPSVTLWAYNRLRDMTEDEQERRSLDVRIAGAALAAADTAKALEAQERLARELPAGSAERRRVVAELIRVEADRSDPAELAERLAAFRREFPDAPELDELAAAVAAGLQARGESEAAHRMLEGVAGPRTSVERAYLLLEAGDVEGARAALGEALPALAPARATPVIQLMGLLDRLGPAGTALVAGSAVLAHRGKGEEAVQRVRDGLAALPEGERPAALAHGARLADDANLPEAAAELRAELLGAHPDAPEVGEATLALARYRSAEPGGVEEAVRLLENLILARPNAPVVPAARRELERLRRGGEGRP